MNAELTTLDKLQSLRWQLLSSVLNNTFVVLTVFGSVFVMFLSELGLDTARIGVLLATLPLAGVMPVFLTGIIGRYGLKRTFMLAFLARKVILLPLLATPLVLTTWGLDIAFWFVLAVVMVFALLRAFSEASWFPWSQEVIPDRVRGKFSAITTIVCTLVGMAAVLGASFIIKTYPQWGLTRYLVLIGIGICAGIASAAAMIPVPGGAPNPDASGTGIRSALSALRDRAYLRFLTGLSLVMLGCAAVFTFIPLFMRTQVQLPADKVVLLDIGIYLGMLLSSYMWGWMADRFGSKPIMITGVIIMMILPILWSIMPRSQADSLYWAMGIAVLVGITTMAWNMGYGRYLFVSAVPADNRRAYLAVFYACQGIIGSIAPLVAGNVVKIFDQTVRHAGPFIIDRYTPLFAGMLILLGAGLAVLAGCRRAGAMPVGRFMGMFFQGHLFMALNSVIRYRFARDEAGRLASTEQMGNARSLVNTDELIEALRDPSFGVRYEAIMAIARSGRNTRLIDELVGILGGNQPELATLAAWALGRMGDHSAILPLREMLTSEYPLLRARCARSLARLQDRGCIPYLHAMLQEEHDAGVCLAYASSLGTLNAAEATPEIMHILREAQDDSIRDELALALAKLAGNEGRYMRLWHGAQADIGTASAQMLLGMHNELAACCRRAHEPATTINQCARAFATADMARAAELLIKIAGAVLERPIVQPREAILRECLQCLKRFGTDRDEYILLTLHTIRCVFRPPRVLVSKSYRHSRFMPRDGDTRLPGHTSTNGTDL